MRFTPLVLATMVGAACAGKNAVVRPDEIVNSNPVPASQLSDLDVPDLIIEKLEEIPVSECTYRSGPGSVVVTLYNGELLNGKVVDKSWDNNDPYVVCFFYFPSLPFRFGLYRGVESMGG